MLEIIETLEDMASLLEKKWRDSEDAALDAQLVSAYVAAHAEIRAQQPFLKIGSHIIRKADIIRVEIKEFNSFYNEPKHVRLYTRDVYGAESYGSTTNYEKFPYDSPEAQMLLAYFADRAETLDLR